MARTVYLALAITLASVQASANDLPDIDAVALCRKQAQSVGQGDWLVKACLDQEQSSYDSLKAQWPGLDAKVRGLCTRQARSVNLGYWMILACVDQELASKRAVDEFKFRK